jgi:AcrR family transcriptional regulator
MARPQRHPDSTLIEAAAATIAAQSGAWSLEDVARRVGMSPAAMIKRFGSKRGLLLAVVTTWVASIPDAPAARDVAEPVAELEALVRQHFSGIEGGSAAGHLGLLLSELGDAEVRGLVAEGWRRQETLYAALLAVAREQGMLHGPPPDRAAALVMALLQGAALLWSVSPSGPLEEFQAGVLRTLLESWR